MKKRVAIISPDFPPSGSGGIVTAHFGMFKSFQNAGFETKVFTYFNDMSQIDLANLNEKTVFRSGPPKLFRKLVKLLSYGSFRLIERAERAYQTSDIVQSAWGAVQLNKALKEFNPHYLIIPDQGCPGLLLDRPSKECRVIMVSHHNPSRFLNNPSFGVHSKRDAALAVWLENKVLSKKVDRVICPSAHMAQEFRRTYKFDGPVAVVANIVDHHQIDAIPANDARAQMGLPATAPVIFIPSAANPLKGADYMRELIRRISMNYEGDLGFILSGDTPDLFKQRLKHLPANVKVLMPGQLSYYENVALMKGCSFGISPTLIESFGMALLEAAFCELPMVSFDVDSVPELLVNQENGMIASFKNVKELIQHSLFLLKNRDTLATLKKQARQTALLRYSSEVTFKRFLEFIESPDSVLNVISTDPIQPLSTPATHDAKKSNSINRHSGS